MREKAVQLNKKIFKSLSLILVCFFLDRWSKIYIINFFVNNDVNDFYVNSYVNLILIWNKGIAFGLFQSETFFYHFISLVIIFIIFFLCYFVLKTKKQIEVVCFSIIIGGALGNLFDRIYYNSVPDFIDLHYKNFHWFTFNVSDICITLGIILLLIFDMIKFNYKNND